MSVPPELAAVVSPAPRSKPAKSPPLASSLLERRLLCENVAVLRVARPVEFRFRPGQRVKLLVGGRKRPYHLASEPGEPFLELCVERVAGGRITPLLWELPAGSPLELKGRAKGSLGFVPERREHLMVASVTGIAPFRSMLGAELGSAVAHRFTLVHGARFADELAYREELEELARRHPQRLRYLPVVSRPKHPRNAGWSGATGLASARAAELADGLDPRVSQVYACGHPGMISAVRAAFRPREFPVLGEAFWKA